MPWAEWQAIAKRIYVDVTGYKFPTQEFRARWNSGEAPLFAAEGAIRNRAAMKTPNADVTGLAPAQEGNS